MKISIYLILVLIFMQSCTFIHFLSVKEKSYDTDIQMQDYFKKNKIDTSYSFRIKPKYLDSLSFQNYALNTYKLKHKGKASAVQIRMYEKGGNFIYGWEQCFGDLKKLGILNDFPFVEKEHLPVNKKLRLVNEINIFDITKNKREKLINKIKDYDYVIIVYWSSWTGWFSKDALKKINNYINENSTHKIMFIKLNVTQIKIQ